MIKSGSLFFFLIVGIQIARVFIFFLFAHMQPSQPSQTPPLPLSCFESARGYGSSLISFFVPPSMELSSAIQQLSREVTTATNIKDRKNSKSVQHSLTYAINALTAFKHTPPNGIIAYSGENWQCV